MDKKTNKQNNKPKSPQNIGGRQEQNMNGQNRSTIQTKSQYVVESFKKITIILQNAMISKTSNTFLKLAKILDKYSNNDEEADDSFIELFKYECDLIFEQHRLEQKEALKKSKSKVTNKNQFKKDRKKEIEDGFIGLKKLDSKEEKDKVISGLFIKRKSKKSKKSKGIEEKYNEPILNKYSQNDIKKLSDDEKVILFGILGKIVNPNYASLKNLYHKLKNFNGKDEWVNKLIKTNKRLFNSIINFLKIHIYDKKDIDKYDKLFIKVFNCYKYEDMNGTKQNERKSVLIAQRFLHSELIKFFKKYKSLFSTIFKYNTFETFENKIFVSNICKEFRDDYKNKIYLKHISINDNGLCLIKVAYNFGLFNTELIPKDRREKCENKFVLLELEKIRLYYNNSDRTHQLKYLNGLPAIFYGKGVSCQNKYGKRYLKYQLYDLSKKPLMYLNVKQRELSFIDLSKCARNSNEYLFVENESKWYDVITKLAYHFCPININQKFIIQQKIDFANILANSATVPTIKMSVLRSESDIVFTALKNKLLSCLTGTKSEIEFQKSRINQVFKFFNDNNLFSIVGSKGKFETWIKSNVINSKIKTEQFNHGLITLKNKLEGKFESKVDNKWTKIEDLKKNFVSTNTKTSEWSKYLLHEDNLPKNTKSEISKYDKEYFEVCSKLGRNLSRKEQKRFSELSDKDKFFRINKRMKEFIGSDKMKDASDNSISHEEFPMDEYLEMKEKSPNFSKNTAIIIIKMWLQNSKISITELFEKIKYILNPNRNKFFLIAIRNVLIFYKKNKDNQYYSSHYRDYMNKCDKFFEERIDDKIDRYEQIKYILSQPIKVKHKGMIRILIAHAKLESKNWKNINVYDFINNLKFSGDGSDLVLNKNYPKSGNICSRNFPKINEHILTNENIDEGLTYGNTFEDGQDGQKEIDHLLPESYVITDLSTFKNVLLVAYENLNGLADEHLDNHLDKTIKHLRGLQENYVENNYLLEGLSYHGTKLKKVLHSSRKNELISRKINDNKITLPEKVVKMIAEKKQESEEKEIIDSIENLYFSNSKIDVKKYLIQLKYFGKRNEVKELFSGLLEEYKKREEEKAILRNLFKKKKKMMKETDKETDEETDKETIRNLFKKKKRKKKKEVVQLRQ